MKPSKKFDRIRKACEQYRYSHGCIVPGCKGNVRLHHMVPRREGGTDAIANLIAICPKHEEPIHNAGAWMRREEAMMKTYFPDTYNERDEVHTGV